VTRPGWWVLGLAGAAWGVLLLAGHEGMSRVPLMVVAMMAPLVIPNVRWLAAASLRRRRLRAVAAFLGGYLLLWVPVAVAVAAAVETLSALLGHAPALAAAFATAVAWQFSPAKHRALRRCTAVRAIPPRGRRADLGCVRYGTTVAAGCVVSCWAVMAAASAAHGVAAMAVMAAGLLVERLPRVYQPGDGASLLVVVGGVLLVGS
jgi:predicted metal-binding membrane protein